MGFTGTIQQLLDAHTIETALRQDSTDAANIRIFQEGLHNLGFGNELNWTDTGADGDYGPGTAAAVKSFAQRNGVASDGRVVTPALGALLIQRFNFLDEMRHLHDAAEDDMTLKLLYRNSPHRVPITVMQTILNELGYGEQLKWARFGADGFYGASTVKAVKAFAKDTDISTDGNAVSQEMARKALAKLNVFFGDAWYEESPMVETESLTISESNKRVTVSDSKHSKTFGKFRLGVYSVGDQKAITFINANRDRLNALDLTDSAMNVMLAVSENEGNLDAINTWDNSFLTFGMFQWTIGARSAQGELPALLKKIKAADPSVFEQYYGRHGLDVTPKTGPIYGFFQLNGRTLRSPGDKKGLRTNTWAFYFWKSGQDPVVQSIQVQHALSRINVFYRSPSYQVAGRDIADSITSEFGVGLILDNHVNRPGYVKPCLQKAVEQAGLAGSNPANWGTAEEQRIIAAYLKIRETYGRTPMTDAAKRAETTRNYLQQGLISDKRGSFKI